MKKGGNSRAKSASLKRSTKSRPMRRALSANDRPVNRHSTLHPVPRRGETMAQFRRRMRRRRTARAFNPAELGRLVTRRNVFTPPTSPTGGKKTKKKGKKSKSKYPTLAQSTIPKPLLKHLKSMGGKKTKKKGKKSKKSKYPTLAQSTIPKPFLKRLKSMGGS